MPRNLQCHASISRPIDLTSTRVLGGSIDPDALARLHRPVTVDASELFARSIGVGSLGDLLPDRRYAPLPHLFGLSKLTPSSLNLPMKDGYAQCDLIGPNLRVGCEMASGDGLPIL
jgi:hypothetical protein